MKCKMFIHFPFHKLKLLAIQLFLGTDFLIIPIVMLTVFVSVSDNNEIEAYHLVASSRLGDSSVLLLDSRGCPTGQVDFPSFSRTRLGGTQRLSARFKAFRFPTSHVVRFAIMVRFCEGKCAQVRPYPIIN
ncbi:unnamed protein product [Diatraea saccharalis]|uniref:ZP domain-containing protein n=1 Tax=Diatraea saccharalis TaxID=40085 RepID=A0A9N9QY21_9NEOP|nr:unnamed protein product [Diatraea saccharalis]